MRLRSEQLGAHLNKGLAALYMIYGDEPLLVQEAADAIRGAARARGYTRECWTVETDCDWDTVLRTAANLSLFTTRRLLELRLGNVKLSDTVGRLLQTYAQCPPEDVLLLIICGKLDLAIQNSDWFKALDAAGVIIQLWPIEVSRLPAWIEQRMQAKGLRSTAEVVTLLAERVEGNLLAAAQEIERLHLLFGGSNLTAQQLKAVVGDSARYTIYDLVDAALAGHAGRCIRILQGLRGEGVDPSLVAWALHREIRLLNQLSFELGQGQVLETVLSRNRVWEKRKPLLRRALQRLTISACRRLLSDCARLDRLIKGLERGNPWDELLNLSLRLAGREVLKALLSLP